MEKTKQNVGESEFSKYVYYDPSSFSGLRWVDRFNSKALKDMELGCFKVTSKGQPDGIVCSINKRKMRAHRVVWELFNGTIPDGMIIDHLNGDPWDNRIENLECKTLADNARNSKKKNNNTSGVTGVLWAIKPKNHLYACAKWIDENGKHCSKSFSARDLGIEVAFKLACEVRLQAIENLKAKGLLYTERNGL